MSKALVRRLATDMLAELALSRAELSILLTDDEGIHELNLQHRKMDKPTDVLAFPIDEKATEPERLLGDVVISIDTAERQASSRKRPLIAELRFLLAHGLLHLIGYDHDTKPRKQRMDAMARRLVRSAPLPELFDASMPSPPATRSPRAPGRSARATRAPRSRRAVPEAEKKPSRTKFARRKRHAV
ncbi:MAG TPA: rRNA maturation RNase YbeY [Polyangiaceae bacterium]|nr:rRNA maturation RNase YbeY [Polyangiaceae bacterium]